MPTPEQDPSASLFKLAIALLDEAMANLRFQHGCGPERDELRKQMPAHLRMIVEANNRAHSAEGFARRALQLAKEEDRWCGEWGRRFAEARDHAPDTLPSMRTTLLCEMQQEHVRASQLADETEQAEREVDDEWCAFERELVREWRLKHTGCLVSLMNAFKPEFERHRHRIAGLVDLAQYRLGNLANGASSAFQVLMTFADRVVHSRAQSIEGLDHDHLRVAVEKEIGWLVRRESTQTDGGWPNEARHHVDNSRRLRGGLSKTAQALLRALRSGTNGTLTTAELVGRLAGCGLGKRTVERELNETSRAAAGLVRHVKRGTWQITEEGMTALAMVENKGSARPSSATKRQSSA